MKKINWHDIRLIVFTAFIFSLGIMLYSFWQTIQRNEDLTQTLAECQHSFEVWSEQIDSGMIQIKMKK